MEIILKEKTIQIPESLNPLFSREYSDEIHTIRLEISGSMNELFNIQEQLKAEEIEQILFDNEDILLKQEKDILTMSTSISSVGELTKHMTQKDTRKKLNISIVFSNIQGEENYDI